MLGDCFFFPQIEPADLVADGTMATGDGFQVRQLLLDLTAFRYSLRIIIRQDRSRSVK